ncbi:MAG: DUF1819 family protein [Bacillota bacterium]|nr:DUF1819 family protein [Bacillota bacterium]
MNSLKYSSGLMSHSFWFHEFRTVVKLREKGMDYEQIKKKCIEENLVGAVKEYRALRITNYIIARVKNMDDRLVELFCESDMPTQKLINLITVIRTDRLFFEFLYEVYREKSIIGTGVLEKEDVNVFFTRKESQSEDIAKWKDTTKKRLGSLYLNFMVDANLLTVIDKKRAITPPILDVELERYLLANGEDAIVKALTGEN